MNIDRVAEMMLTAGSSAKVRGISDSGWYLEGKNAHLAQCKNNPKNYDRPSDIIMKGIGWVTCLLCFTLILQLFNPISSSPLYFPLYFHSILLPTTLLHSILLHSTLLYSTLLHFTSLHFTPFHSLHSLYPSHLTLFCFQILEWGCSREMCWTISWSLLEMLFRSQYLSNFKK